MYAESIASYGIDTPTLFELCPNFSLINSVTVSLAAGDPLTLHVSLFLTSRGVHMPNM